MNLQIYRTTVHYTPLITDANPEPEFLTFYGAQESIPRINSAILCSLTGRYDNLIPTRFLAPIDCYKIPALIENAAYCVKTHKRI
jgi:hypothetical protein